MTTSKPTPKPTKKRAGATPQLRQNNRGTWICKWGGRTFSFGGDFQVAQKAFLHPDGHHAGALVNWARWQRLKAEAAGRRKASGGLRGSGTITELVDLFLDSYLAEGRPDTREYYRKHLVRFTHALGRFKPSEIDLAALAAFRADIMAMGYAPKTIRHDLGAVKTFWTWAEDLHSAPPLNLRSRALRSPGVPAPRPVQLTPAERFSMFTSASLRDPRLVPWLALCYLCALRPSECVRLVAGEGRWVPILNADGQPIEGACFELARSKTEHRIQSPRYVVLNASARAALSRAVPVWHRLDSFSAAARRACAHPPKVLRSSAASDLYDQQVARADVRLFLGHWPSDAGSSYIRTVGPTLLRIADRLSV